MLNQTYFDATLVLKVIESSLKNYCLFSIVLLTSLVSFFLLINNKGKLSNCFRV